MKKHLLKTRLLSFAALCGIALTFASCANEDVAQNPTNPNEDNDKNLTTFIAGDETKTRTSMDYNSGNFYWEAGDHIWVQDDNNVWQKSSNAPTGKTASFKFKVPGKFTAKTSYQVYYPGKNGTNNQVTIPAAQTQTAAHNTQHFGVSGDCGIAMATKAAGTAQFNFKLDHQAAILVFQPYLGNDNKLVSTYVTQIEVTSNNNITGTYTLLPTTGALTGAGTAKQITLTTKAASGTFANGFPLTKSTPNVAENGAYMVIMPGSHALTVKFTLKDVQTGVEGTITKTYASFLYEKNNYYDMTANLQITNYAADKYYMWDAKQPYWKGYEWNNGGSQPTLNHGIPGATTSNDYAKNNTDPRYWGESGIYISASNTCKNLPNANEMSWYAMYGDPRWDADQQWTTMGHLYKGGMWFKKKSVLVAEGRYSAVKAADGSTDLRATWKQFKNTNSSIRNSGLPSAANAANYFYLPAFGYYLTGMQIAIGRQGYYWSSSSSPWDKNNACDLCFDSGSAEIVSNSRFFGFRVGGVE